MKFSVSDIALFLPDESLEQGRNASH